MPATGTPAASASATSCTTRAIASSRIVASGRTSASPTWRVIETVRPAIAGTVVSGAVPEESNERRATPPEGFRQHRFTPPPGATTVLLVRHGESRPAHPDRPFPLVDGHGDPPLDPVGERQAELLGERLAREPIAAIYVTNLRRTRQTAAPTARRLGLTPVVESDLREVFLGEWEGGEFRMRAVAGDPIFQQIFAEERWDVIPGAEAHDTFDERVWRGFQRIVAAHPDKRSWPSRTAA